MGYFMDSYSPHKPFWLLVMQNTIVICLRYMMIAIQPHPVSYTRKAYARISDDRCSFLRQSGGVAFVYTLNHANML